MKGKYREKHNKKKDELSVNGEAEKQSDLANTPEDVEIVLDELAAIPKKQRIWEIDFLRGLMILFVVWDHFMFDVRFVGSGYSSGLFIWLLDFAKSYYSGVLRSVTHDAFVTMFVFTSGVSCSFSRSNGKRALKMMAFACLLTAVTYAVSSIVGKNLTMRFNVIHVIALSTLLWTVIEFCWEKCVKNWQKNVFGVVMLAVTLTSIVVGACANFRPWDSDNKLWYFLAQHLVMKDDVPTDFANFVGGDYLAFLPDFGWFLVGAFLGKIAYKERKSLFPSVNPKYVCPITFCGKYSLWVYVCSQVVMFGLIYLFSNVLSWL